MFLQIIESSVSAQEGREIILYMRKQGTRMEKQQRNISKISQVSRLF